MMTRPWRLTAESAEGAETRGLEIGEERGEYIEVEND